MGGARGENTVFMIRQTDRQDTHTYKHTFCITRDIYFHISFDIISSYIYVCSVGIINLFNFFIHIVQSYSWMTLTGKLTAIIREYKVYFQVQLQKCSHEG